MNIENYVTGANGFVGKHLSERLLNVSPIPHDRIQSTELQPFRRFYFLSAYGNMSWHTEDDQIIKANLLDLVHTIAQASTHEFESFIYMSTSSVKLPIQTMYSRTKEAAEKVLLAYMEKYNLPIAIVRPYSITGVGEQKQHLIPKLIDSCLNGTQMDFIASPRHDFIDVIDVVSALETIANRKSKGIHEVGTGLSYSNDEVKDIVEEKTGKKANLHYVGRMRAYDTNTWESTNQKMGNLGWRPKKTLEQSIGEMVEYERSRQK